MYEGRIYRILSWDHQWVLLDSYSRSGEVAHAVEWNDKGQFRCTCEWQEFGNPRCGHEKFMKAVLDEKKRREKKQ